MARVFIEKPSDFFENVPREEDKAYSMNVNETSGKIESADNIIEFTESIKTSFIEIEYYNNFGKQNAKLLLTYIDENPKLFKTLLKDYKKITIGNNNDDTLNFIFCEIPISMETFIHELSEKIKETTSFYSDALVEKLEGKEILSSEDEFNYFDQQLEDCNGIKMKTTNNSKYNPEVASLINYCFNNNDYELLYKLLKNEYTDAEKRIVYCDYWKRTDNIEILNHLLKKQTTILENHDGLFGIDNFLANNLLPLIGIFIYEPFRFMFTETNEPEKDKIPKIDFDTTIKLVDSSLDFIDESGSLKCEFHKKVEDGTISMYYPSESITENIYADMYFDASNNITNIPLTGSLVDVFTTIHEFAHLHSFLQNPDKITSAENTFSEFQSIMFETLVCINLKNEGYDPKTIGNLLNVRTNWIKKDYGNSFSSMLMLSLYKKHGKVTKDLLKTCFKEQTTNDNDFDSKLDTLINNTNTNLRVDTLNIYTHYKYILGYILTRNILSKYDINHEDTKKWLLGIVDSIPITDDPCEIFDALGFDTEKMGFKRQNTYSHNTLKNDIEGKKEFTKK